MVVIVIEALDSLNAIIDYNYGKIETIKRKYGVIKKLIPDTDSAKVKVKIRDINNEDYIKPDEDEEEQEDPDEKNWLTMLNKTGERLEVGDCVWVYYWRTITDGYVAIKIGTKHHSGKDLDVKLERAMTITDHDETIADISDTTASFEIGNRISYGYQESPNVIFVGGCPAVYYADLDNVPDIVSQPTAYSEDDPIYGGKVKKINEFKAFVRSLGTSYFTKQADHIYSRSPVSSLSRDGTTQTQCYSFKYVCDYVRAISPNTQSVLPVGVSKMLYPGIIGLGHTDTNVENGLWWNVGADGFSHTPRDSGTLYTDDFNLYRDNDGVDAFFTSDVDGGFIFIFNEVVISDPNLSTPFGYVKGRWLGRCFGNGFRLYNQDTQYMTNDIMWCYKYLQTTPARHTDVLYNFCPAFGSYDEREYARQVISRSESQAY